MNTKRELQFLNYLDALESGDAEGISAFLALAEADAELEKMMMDYHREASPVEKPKVITPFKRKREDVNHWLARFGNGLVAAIVMVVVGLAGVYIGANRLGISAFINANPSNPVNSEQCVVEIVSEDNQITLLADGDLDRTITVGVNNPFIVLPGSGHGGGYSAIFEGLRVTITRSSLNVSEGCARLSSVTVYPKYQPDSTCSLEIERLKFPMEEYLLSMQSFGYSPYMQAIVLLGEPVDGNYPILDPLFEGNIPAEYIRETGNCSSYPLLYIQPGEYLNSSPNDGSYPTIDVTGLRVQEQQFENGAMFYLEAVNQIWVSCETAQAPWSPWTIMPGEVVMSINPEARGFPPEGLFEPQGVLVAPWEVITDPGAYGAEGAICELGWGTARMESYDAAYSYENAVHHLTRSTGEVYSFYESDTGGLFWRDDEN